MSIDKHKKQFGKILDVADTYHDMANLPDSFSSLRKEGRCLIDGTPGHNLKFIQKNLVSYKSLFDRDPHLLLLSDFKDEEQSAVQNAYGNEGKTFTSYEDWVSHVTVLENQGIFAQNVELFNVPLTQDLFIGVTKPMFMIDAVNNNAFYDMFMDQDNYLETIATRWDQAPKKGNPTYVPDLHIIPCGETGKHIQFRGDYVVFYNPNSGGDSQEIGKLSKNCLQFLKIGVKNLCKTINDVKTMIDDFKTITDKEQHVLKIVQENLLFTGKNRQGINSASAKSGKRPRSDDDKVGNCAKLLKTDDGKSEAKALELSNDFIAERLAKFITTGSIENIFNIKRSGDYGQIGAVQSYNNAMHVHDPENTRCYLVTFDRLCFLRARFEHVPCIRVYQNGTIDVSHGIISNRELIKRALIGTLDKLKTAENAYKNYSVKDPSDIQHIVEQTVYPLPEDTIEKDKFITGLLGFTDKTRKNEIDPDQHTPTLKEVFEDEEMYTDSRFPLIFLIDHTYDRVKNLAHQVNNEIYTSLVTLLRKIRLFQGMTIDYDDTNTNEKLEELSENIMKERISSMSNLTNKLNFLSDIRSIDRNKLKTLESGLKEKFENSSYRFDIKDLGNKNHPIEIRDTPNILVDDQTLIHLMGNNLFEGEHVKRIMEGVSVHFISDIEKLVKVKNKNVKPMSPLLVFYQILSNMIVLKSERVLSRRNANLHMLANVIEDTFIDAIERIREERESLLAVWDKFLPKAKGQSEPSFESTHIGGSPLFTPHHPPSTPYELDEFGEGWPPSTFNSDIVNNGDKDEDGYEDGYEDVKKKLFDENQSRAQYEMDVEAETEITGIIERTPEECFYNAANALEHIEGIASINSDAYNEMLVKVALFDFVKLPCFSDLTTFADSVFNAQLKVAVSGDESHDVFNIGRLDAIEDNLRYRYFLAPLINPDVYLTLDRIWDITEYRYDLLQEHYEIQNKKATAIEGGGSPSFSTRPLPRGVSFKPDRAQGYYRSTEEVREMLAALSFKRRSRFF